MKQENEKPGKVKSLADRENVRAFLQFIKTSGYPFRVKITNYTTEIQSDLFNRYFMQSTRSKSCFAAYSKLKSDVSDKVPPDIDKGGLVYFAHDFKRDLQEQTVINVDLKSAYATALFNAKYITQATSDYLGKIPKMDRLAAVGMLASKKHVFSYDEKGELLNYIKEVAPTENFFYLAVRIVQDTMQQLKAICGRAYLFTWVDGIYFLPEPGLTEQVEQAAKDLGFRCTTETLSNFTVRIGSKVISVTFEKDDRRKQFKIPTNKAIFANDLINYLTYKK